MPLKATPNHAFYIETLRRMGPEARLMKAFELSEFAKSVFLDGLRQTFPHLSEQELRRLALDRLAKCHNRNY
jgi:hypothetical protein